LERELINAKRKIIEERNATYSVAAPEDIVIPKLVRSINSLIRHPEFREYIPQSELSLSDEYIAERLDFINHLREVCMDSIQDLELFEKLKFISDIFDIRVLSEIAGINTNYFEKSSDDWRVLRDNSHQKEILSNFILPKLNNLSLI
jgi:hypothetical protein